MKELKADEQFVSVRVKVWTTPTSKSLNTIAYGLLIKDFPTNSFPPTF